MASMKNGDDPKDFGVDDVNAYLEDADEAESQRVLSAEAGGKKRKSILEEHGFDASKRYDGTGRELHPWETDPVKAAQAGRAVPRDVGPENQQSPDSDATAAGGGDAQPATTPAGSGTAAPSGATGGTPGTSDAGTTAGADATV